MRQCIIRASAKRYEERVIGTLFMLTHIDGLFYDSDALIDEIIGGGHG